jgi:hypothetical protein
VVPIYTPLGPGPDGLGRYGGRDVLRGVMGGLCMGHRAGGEPQRGPEPRRTPAHKRNLAAVLGYSLLVRVSVLAVCCYHVDSPAIEVHRIVAVTAVDGICARVVVSLDYVIA